MGDDSDEFERFTLPYVPDEDVTMEGLCDQSGGIQIQPHQEFYSEYLDPHRNTNNFIVWAGLGSGKTAVAILLAEKYVRYLRHELRQPDTKIVVCVPKALIGNFKTELRKGFAEDAYISAVERGQLSSGELTHSERTKIIDKSNKRIEKNYYFVTHQSFFEKYRAGEFTLENTLLIIDEIHQIISVNPKTNIYRQFHEIIHDPAVFPTLRVVGFTATPIKDHPMELPLLLNLISALDEQMKASYFERKYFEKTTVKKKLQDKSEVPLDSLVLRDDHRDELAMHLRGKIGYFRGMHQKAYPEVERFHFVNVVMSRKQSELFYEAYMPKEGNDVDQAAITNVLNKNAFYARARIASNSAYTTSKTEERALGAEAYTKVSMRENSCKLKLFVHKLKESKGLVYVFSNFVNVGGVQMIADALSVNGYEALDVADPFSEARPRFAVLTGEDQANLSHVVDVWNDVRNKTGQYLKVIIGSPVLRAGINLRRTREIHMFDPYWDWPYMEQIEGRGNRFCGHMDLRAQDRNLKIFYYCAHPDQETAAKILKNKNIKFSSLDEYLYTIADMKQDINNQLLNMMQLTAVDCPYFLNANRPDLQGLFPAYSDNPEEGYCWDWKSTEEVMAQLPKAIAEAEIAKFGKEAKVLKFVRNSDSDYDVRFLDNLMAEQWTKKTGRIAEIDVVAYRLKTEVEGEELAKRRSRLIIKKVLDWRNGLGIGADRIKVLGRTGEPDVSSTKVQFVLSYHPPDKEMKKKTSQKPQLATRKSAKGRCPAERQPSAQGHCSLEFPYLRTYKTGEKCCTINPPTGQSKKELNVDPYFIYDEFVGGAGEGTLIYRGNMLLGNELTETHKRKLRAIFADYDSKDLYPLRNATRNTINTALAKLTARRIEKGWVEPPRE